MTQALHTPGPWVAHPSALERFSQVISARGCMVQICHTREVYGDRMVYGQSEETRANAALIAAAPDLLQMVIDLLDAMGNCDSEIESGARDLIAKATGSAS